LLVAGLRSATRIASRFSAWSAVGNQRLVAGEDHAVRHRESPLPGIELGDDLSGFGIEHDDADKPIFRGVVGRFRVQVAIFDDARIRPPRNGFGGPPEFARDEIERLQLLKTVA
jgi:hypothetical protein